LSGIQQGVTETRDAAGWQAYNNAIAEEFRANEGRVGGEYQGADLLLLTTTGAKTGRTRLAVLANLSVEGRMIIVGSLGGAPNHPDWVHNLRANPGAHVEVGATGYDVVAREMPAGERAEIFPKVVAMQPLFGEYQNRTTRVIPLFELQRAE
jgi:deazaflavin-dependent oxidoreductase (nitroreductase family)